MKMKTFTIDVKIFDGTDAKALENLLEYAFDEAGIDGVCYVEEAEEEKAMNVGAGLESRAVRTIDVLENFLEDHGWHVGWTRDVWLLTKTSPAGEDFQFEIVHDGDIDRAFQAIKDFTADFDPALHVARVLDAQKKGRIHSTRLGALPNVEALVEDAVAIKQMLCELEEELSGVYGQEPKTIAETLADAEERSEDYKGLNAYDKIQRLTALKKERPLTQEEEETLFYCKNATAEQDCYDSLD